MAGLSLAADFDVSQAALLRLPGDAMAPQSMQASRHAATTIASISKEEMCSIGRWPYSVPLPEVYRDGEGRFSRTTIFSCAVLVRARPEVADRLLLTDVGCCGHICPKYVVTELNSFWLRCK